MNLCQGDRLLLSDLECHGQCYDLINKKEKDKQSSSEGILSEDFSIEEDSSDGESSGSDESANQQSQKPSKSSGLSRFKNVVKKFIPGIRLKQSKNVKEGQKSPIHSQVRIMISIPTFLGLAKVMAKVS